MFDLMVVERFLYIGSFIYKNIFALVGMSLEYFFFNCSILSELYKGFFQFCVERELTPYDFLNNFLFHNVQQIYTKNV